jgi:peptidylprolyl isomerase
MGLAKQGDTVRVHYTGTLTDGTVFDSSEGGDPLEFTLGGGDLIPGFEQIVMGMSEGERRTGTIAPEDAYGVHDDRLVLVVDRSTLPDEVEPEVGEELELESEAGETLPVVITEITESEVTLDGNHPLAGKELIFTIDLVEIA